MRAMATVRFLGQEDPLEEGMAIHSSIPAWIESLKGLVGRGHGRKFGPHSSVREAPGGFVTGVSVEEEEDRGVGIELGGSESVHNHPSSEVDPEPWPHPEC